MEQDRVRFDDERAQPSLMSRKEQELDKTRTFFLALEELQSLRPQLYQAADYCEHQYLFSDNKQGVHDNLKDYSVKALVNAVDHLGTVAFKLNDLIALRNEEIDDTQLAASAVAQRLRACQEHSDSEGLKQQSMAKTMHVNHKQYTLAVESENAPARAGQRTLLRETFDLSHPAPLSQMLNAESQVPLPHTPRSELNDSQDSENSSGPQNWFFASELSAATKTPESDFARSFSVAKQPPPAPSLAARTSFLNRSATLSSKQATTQAGRPAVSPLKRFTEAPAAAGASMRSTTTRSESLAPTRIRSGSMTPIRTPPPLAHAPSKNHHNLEKTMFMTSQAPPPEAKTSKGKGILRSLLGRKT